MKKLVAIIVGGTGQFGIITSNLLLKKNYKVVVTTRNIKKKKLFNKNKNLDVVKLDIYNKESIKKLLIKYKPQIIFYYAGQSSPSKSFFKKKETYRSNVIGCENFLKIILRKKPDTKFVNASSCEIYGKLKGKIKVTSVKKPVNPYGISKLESYKISKRYRDKYNLKSYNAIIFNTESFYRDKVYLIPKICIAAINAKRKKIKTKFGNLKISREWNWCEEQIKYLYKFIKKEPQDFILSNGKNYSALDMLKFAFRYFDLDYKKFVLFNNKKFLRKKDINDKRSNYKYCLNRNKILRKDKVYGKKLVKKLIEFYLNKHKIKSNRLLS